MLHILDVLEATIDEQRELERRLDELKELDDGSKEQIKERVWDTYKYMQFISELEKA